MFTRNKIFIKSINIVDLMQLRKLVTLTQVAKTVVYKSDSGLFC